MGALDTLSVVPQSAEYLGLRAAGWSHDEAMEQLEHDHRWLVEHGGADTDSAVYRFFDVHDDL